MSNFNESVVNAMNPSRYRQYLVTLAIQQMKNLLKELSYDNNCFIKLQTIKSSQDFTIIVALYNQNKKFISESICDGLKFWELLEKLEAREKRSFNDLKRIVKKCTL